MIHSFNKLIFIFIIVFIIAAVLSLVGNEKLRNKSSVSPSSTLAPDISQNTEVNSADGAMKIIMEKTVRGSGSRMYSFFTTDKQGNQKLILTKTFLGSGGMSVPVNSWSPDNKYLFLKEENATMSSFLVFKQSGDNFSTGESYLDIVPLFLARKSLYTLADVTGWDSDTLLHVVTTGPPFWFEVPSKSFIQLAR